MKNLNVFLMVCMLLVASCNKETDVNLIQQHEGHEVIFSPRIEGHVMTRVSDNNWENGDKIGIFAVKSGKTLENEYVFENNSNVLYEFSNNKFASSTPIRFPKKTDEKLDFIAYYPYKEDIKDYEYPIDVSTQDKLSGLDVLYSNDAKEKNKDSVDVILNFQYKLALLVLKINAKDGLSTLEGLSVTLNNILSEGVLDLTNGALSTTGSKMSITANVVLDEKKEVATSSALLIPQTIKTPIKAKIKLNNTSYEFDLPMEGIEENKRYILEIEVYPTRVQTNLSKFQIISRDTIQLDKIEIEPEENNTETPEPENPGGSGTQEPGENTPQESDFTLDKSNMSFESEGDLSEAVHIELPKDVEWSITANPDWITCAQTNGTGSGDATITVSENTASTARTGTVTVTPTNSQHNPKTITISQKGKIASNPQEPQLLFPGSDFEDKALFISSIQKDTHCFILTKEKGLNNSTALEIVTSCDTIFTAKAPTNLSIKDKTKIKFFIKGSSSKISLSVCLFLNDGTKKWFNLENYTAEQVLRANERKKIDGFIDTNKQWLSVTLDISEIAEKIVCDKGELFFSLYGLESTSGYYEIYIDHITIE